MTITGPIGRNAGNSGQMNLLKSPHSLPTGDVLVGADGARSRVRWQIVAIEGELLARLPDETVVDGEVVALDESGRPSFNALQNHGGSEGRVHYYVFDVLVLAGRDVDA